MRKPLARFHAWIIEARRPISRFRGTLFEDEDHMSDLDPKTEVELEAAAFRRLVQHLRERNGVQNLDLMNLAGFCRNCLSNWYQEAAAERGLAVSKDAAREKI